MSGPDQPRPSEVFLIGQRFRVELVPPDAPELESGSNADMARIGTARLTEQRIIVANTLASDQERDTVLHELLHVIVRLVALIPKDQEEERIIVALTPLLLDALRRNPELVAYLTRADG